MGLLEPPHLVTIDSWCLDMKVATMKQLLFQAASEHPARFTNPEEVAEGWLNKLGGGFYGLPDYARGFLSHQYLMWRGDVAA